MATSKNPLDYLYALNRYRFLTLLNAANECDEHTFAKQAEMLWLVNYPGDLYVQYLQAKTLASLGKKAHANKILSAVVTYDPEFIEPYQVLTEIASDDENKAQFERVSLYLTQETGLDQEAGDWLGTLKEARLAYRQKSYNEAILLINQSMVNAPSSPLPAILHLKIAYQLGNEDMLSNLGEIYINRWPDCLQVNVIKALNDMTQGLTSQAVERLHWIAAHDSAGQVIQRLMGENHRFKDLWPDRMEIFFDLPIPGSISGFLGWNQLQPGDIETPEFKQKPENDGAPQVENNKTLGQNLTDETLSENEGGSKGQSDEAESLSPLEDYPTAEKHEILASEEDFKEIQDAFSRLAKRAKKPDLDRSDSRYPVYVILTSKKQLEDNYGPNTAEVIRDLLSDLVMNIQQLPNWGSLLFVPDDPGLMSQFGLKPRLANDAWQMKLSLADLDAALAEQGEMIGALLIVGGPEIVPFHHLPNPTHDSDLDVASDNPYSTVDENYFIPQWPVGRLPGESGPDSGLLLSQIRDLVYQYQKRVKGAKSGTANFASLFNWILRLFSSISLPQSRKNMGYAAEIWQEPARGVYKAVGRPRELVLSPPTHSGTLLLAGSQGYRLGYFNLHGVKDGPNWYGQKDFTSNAAGPDYPIALSPTMFNERQSAPELLLTEACYGAHVLGKRHEDALSLKCLDSGTRTFIGSTCIAYGSITMPLIAADYLAESFWQRVKDGEPAGYALMQAKLSLAEEMTRVQGFLDGEDQKTILSFVLYGDPLAVHDGIKTMPKPMFRMKSHPKVKTLSDSDLEVSLDGQTIPRNLDKQVKKLTEKYLPGLQNAKMHVQKSGLTGRKDPRETDDAGRYVVTLQKSFDENQHTVHQHFARMTFDKRGKLVKFTTSR